MIVRIQKLLRNIYLLPLYLFARLWPKNKKFWVFGSWFGLRYADNSRYVYEYVLQNCPEILAVWVTRSEHVENTLISKGLPVIRTGTLLGVLRTMSAGVSFVTCGTLDLGLIVAPGAFCVQLWHGTPLKKIKNDDLVFEHRDESIIYRTVRQLYRVFFPFMRDKDDVVIAPSPYIAPRLETAFLKPPERVWQTGYPRGDVILSSTPSSVPVIKELAKTLQPKKILLYAPTHRKEGRGNIDLLEGLHDSGMHEVLEKHDVVLLVKKHFYEKSDPHRKFRRIIAVTDEDVPDINHLLPFIDILITDYSSVFYDYLLLDRPIVFVPFDITDYTKEDREFYIDYKSEIVGPCCFNWREAATAVDDILKGNDFYHDARLAAQSKFNMYIDTNNSKRIVKKLYSLLEI